MHNMNKLVKTHLSKIINHILKSRYAILAFLSLLSLHFANTLFYYQIFSNHSVFTIIFLLQTSICYNIFSYQGHFTIKNFSSSDYVNLKPTESYITLIRM